MARYDLGRDDVARLLPGQPLFRAEQVWEGLYRQGLGPERLTTLPKDLRSRLAEDPAFQPALRLQREAVSDGGATVKWLWCLADDRSIETVLMEYGSRTDRHGRTTVCVSSQAGCAMGCGFCATGQAGFDRNLSVGEIVEQVVRAMTAARARGRRLSNVVFMGMGEPLANYDRVWTSIERVHADLGLSARSITVSTIGIVPGIRRLATEHLPVGLAVSLHAANDELRDELVPLNRRHPLNSLMEACRDYRAKRNRRLSFEWALIDGVNDTAEDAQELANLALPLRAHVNLIPLNRTAGFPTRGTPPGRIRGFRDSLKALGVNATIRQNRGTAIEAACGQLASRGRTPTFAKLA